MKTAILLGSSRTSGNTAQLSQYVGKKIAAEIFDLNNYKIKPFNYNAQYQDDFQTLIDKLLDYNRIILASPMYWYSASAQMKLFLDRLSDLLNGEKDKGRKLRGKYTALLATGGDTTPPNCFEEMFELTFKYLGMNYQGMGYQTCTSDIKITSHMPQIDSLIKRLLSTPYA